jgi:predicted O-linked N-acetylglucosamine transferase (SPINDLY family)
MKNRKPIALTPKQNKMIKQSVALHQSGKLDEAEAQYKKLLNFLPNNTTLLTNLGTIFLQKSNLEDGVRILDRSLAIDPNQPNALINCGIALKQLKRLDEAVASYDRAIALNPNYAEANYNRGNALQDLKRLDEAVASYDRAIALNPNYAEAYSNRGNVLQELKQFDAAIINYNKAIELIHDHQFLNGVRLHTKMYICDWNNYDDEITALAEKIKLNEKASTPFAILALFDSLSLQRKTTEIYVQHKFLIDNALPKLSKYSRHEKIRIGYFSADFRNHPVSHLMAGLLEIHNRSNFEITAFYFGPNVRDAMRRRIEAGVDKFIDVGSISDKDVALLSRSMEIDIGIDITGHTAHSRPGIFTNRAAPIQAGYLGYPGTTGASYIDYLIADQTVIPQDHQKYYSEKIVYLPNSYQVNDTKREIADKVFTRQELGIPENGFVLCSFNNNYKITPKTFDGWMRILKKIEGSVLWLLEDNPSAAVNLQKEAQFRGVSKERLIFAQRMKPLEHLARHRVADLFLDTLPYNAHTTASDALWAGLPVLTCMGESFASRVAASLLNAIHLPELITTSQEEYENLAVELATHPEKLQIIKQKLAANRLSTPLFNTKLFTTNIENAYSKMYERYHADLSPDNIDLNIGQKGTFCLMVNECDLFYENLTFL